MRQQDATHTFPPFHRHMTCPGAQQPLTVREVWAPGVWTILTIRAVSGTLFTGRQSREMRELRKVDLPAWVGGQEGGHTQSGVVKQQQLGWQLRWWLEQCPDAACTRTRSPSGRALHPSSLCLSCLSYQKPLLALPAFVRARTAQERVFCSWRVLREA